MNQLEQIKSQLIGLNLECDYWDVRVEETTESAIQIIDGEVTTCSVSPSSGAFLRVRKNGFWFNEATTQINNLKESLIQLAKQEIESKADYKYEPEKQAPYANIKYIETNMSLIAIDVKLTLLQAYDKHIKTEKYLSSCISNYKDIYKIKSFFNSVGTEFEYDFNQCGIALRYTLKDDNSIFEDKTMMYSSNFEGIKNKEKEITLAVEESSKFLSAQSVTPGKYTVLLSPKVAGVFTHESFGHKSEADLMLGDPLALEDWKIGSVIASEKLTIVDCGQHVDVAGYCPVDDEGLPAQKNYLIQNGKLSGRLHSLDTSYQFNEKPTGNARALNFEFEPIVRMTSTYIEPGTDSLAEILEKSEGAILVEGVKHGTGLSTFTIAPHRGYLIRKGGIKKPVRLAVISGSVFDTLKNIVAVSSDFELHSSALGGCGKMDQSPLPVSDGGPYVLVKGMQVS